MSNYDILIELYFFNEFVSRYRLDCINYFLFLMRLVCVLYGMKFIYLIDIRNMLYYIVILNIERMKIKTKKFEMLTYRCVDIYFLVRIHSN